MLKLISPFKDLVVMNYGHYILNKGRKRIENHVIVCCKSHPYETTIKMSSINGFYIKAISLGEFSKICGLGYNQLYKLYSQGKFKMYDGEKPSKCKVRIMIDINDAIAVLDKLGMELEASRAYTCYDYLANYIFGTIDSAIDNCGLAIVRED